MQNLVGCFRLTEKTIRPLMDRLLSLYLAHRSERTVSCITACTFVTGDQEIAGSTPARSATCFIETDHEIFSMVILSLLLIQEGRLSVSDERMCTMLVNRLDD